MAASTRTGRLTLAGLIVLSAVPVLIGLMRLGDLASGGPITPENARFHAAPVPIVIHVLSSAVFAILGAAQFTVGAAARKRAWHRVAGRLVVASGFATATSGLALTLTYPDADFSGPALFAMRLAVGAGMNAFLLLGLRSIMRREFAAHGEWMIRAYALATGAGTQFFTHLPWLFFPSIRGEAARAFLMGLGWAINVAAAEAIIRRARHAPPAVAHPAPARV